MVLNTSDFENDNDLIDSIMPDLSFAEYNCHTDSKSMG
jgi:hypothetical protein